MSTYTDDQRTLTGIAVNAEKGHVPGAVASLRRRLREATPNLPRLVKEIESREHQLTGAKAELVIWRETCDELMDAIKALGGAVSGDE